MSENVFSFEGWAILELMGHRKMAGRYNPCNFRFSSANPN